MAVISFCIRSAIPGYMVVPPERTVLAYRSLRISMSHFMMPLKQPSWMPTTSIPKKDGRNMDSGQRKRSLPTVTIWPSGNSYDFSMEEEEAAVAISCSKSRATQQSFSLTSRTISRSAVVTMAYPLSDMIFIR